MPAPGVRFSIVTVCYNPGETIDACLRSVAAQGYPHIEHIVIDGASPDGTADRIRGFDWFKGRLVSEPDQGIYDAMNKGAALATGDYLGFLNADDMLSDPDAIARLAAAAEAHPGADAVQGDVVIVDPERPNRRRYYSGAGNWRRRLEWGQMPPHPGFYIRTALFREMGGFSTEYRIAADYDLMLRFFCTGARRAVHVASPVVTMATGGVSNQGLQSRRIINREIGIACKRNGVRTNRLKIWSKYLTKIFQYWPRRTA
ncbi:MAG TPA: glycosyltransferase family 2 protein [Sphingopyxis sp.]|nr:glycosyltransferase family 2 protein [Sphingopyxis sp.]HMP44156.1 glycosyltransferase family 2 protein [Sphingopyxis sp.]HMQ19300.1 glycosyltransferase family 2 protein [Sphingopyxis sp.]